jgi:LysM repeat protein
VRAIWLATVLTLLITLALAVGWAASLTVDGGTLQVFGFPVDVGPIAATVDVDPDTLNLKSEGQPVTAYIELPQGYDVGNIDVATVRLCLGQASACPEGTSVPAQQHPSAVDDHDGDIIPDRMVKFDRRELVELLDGQTGDVTMSVTGIVTPPGESFAGSDTIRVIDRGCGGMHADACPEEEDLPEEKLPQDAPPPTPEAPPPTPAVATVEYTVRPGESLSDVAAFFGTTVEAIVALNGLTNPDLVAPGQRLLVPAPPATTAPGRVFMSEYVVQPGENLTDIAARFGTTVEALAAANSLANPSAIRIGDRLLVP